MFNPFLFKGFEPSYEVSTASNLVLNLAMEMAPADAISFGYLIKDKNSFCGHLEICSSHGIFSAYATSNDPEKVLNKLKSRIVRQLKHWKRTRFPPIPNAVGSMTMDVA
jgi:hypothetical protein